MFVVSDGALVDVANLVADGGAAVSGATLLLGSATAGGPLSLAAGGSLTADTLDGGSIEIGAMSASIGSATADGRLAANVGGALTLLFGRFFEVPAFFQVQAAVAFGLMAIHVSAGFIGLLPEGIMFAHHDFVVRNLIRIAGVLLRLGLTIATLTLPALSCSVKPRPLTTRIPNVSKYSGVII